MMTQSHKVVIIIDASNSLSFIRQQLIETVRITDEYLLAEYTTLISKMMFDRLGIGWVRYIRPAHLSDNSWMHFCRIADAAGVYSWLLFCNIFAEWIIIDELKMVGYKELWLCLHKK